MKVLALQRESHVALGVPSLSVSARITEVLEYMESYGELEFTVIPEKSELARAGVRWADILILSKHSSRQALELVVWAKKCGVQVIYDIDDWIFSFPKYSGGQSQNDRIELINELIALSDVVTVANKILLRKITTIMPAQTPVLVPNGMWVEKYVCLDQMSSTEASPPRIVFTNADLLKIQSAKGELLTAIQVFFQRHPDYVLDFYGDPFPEMFSLPFLHFTNRMPYPDYMNALVSGRYQFAITPLGSDEDPEATEFNACKNPFKYLNYGTALVPGLYSQSPIYKGYVIDRETGVLTRNNYASWYDALEFMSSDSALRQRIRHAAFDDIMENHHVRGCAAAIRQVLSGN